MREYKLRDTRTNAFREMTGIEKASLWSRARLLARSLARSATRLTVYERECRGCDGHIRPRLSLSPFICLLFSYLLIPFPPFLLPPLSSSSFHHLYSQRHVYDNYKQMTWSIHGCDRDITLSNDETETNAFHADQKNRIDFTR